jgi:hypothetical protein
MVGTDCWALRPPLARPGVAPYQIAPNRLVDLFFRSPRISVD